MPQRSHTQPYLKPFHSIKRCFHSCISVWVEGLMLLLFLDMFVVMKGYICVLLSALERPLCVFPSLSPESNQHNTDSHSILFPLSLSFYLSLFVSGYFPHVTQTDWPNACVKDQSHFFNDRVIPVTDWNLSFPNHSVTGYTAYDCVFVCQLCGYCLKSEILMCMR